MVVKAVGSGTRYFLAVGVGAALLASLAAPLVAQQQATLLASLPDAPGRGASAQTPEGQPATGSISGTVLDINEGVVSGAKITLVDESHAPERTTTSDAEGHFTFPGVSPGRFKVTITSSGLESFISNDITLHHGEHHILPRVALPLASADVSVQVTVTQVEIAQEQIQLQEKQRAFGIIPNFYSSYVWDAAPLNTRQKFSLATRSVTDPVIFIATGVAAGIEQARNTFPAYGQGTKGYAKRFGSDYADEVSNRMFSSAIYPSLFHQDPRYFYKGTGSKRSRAWYAVTRAFVIRSDEGNSQPNYSRILGAFTSGALSNTYHQGRDRGIGLTSRNSAIAIGAYAADNLLREFLFRKISTNVPDYAKGKPETTP